MEAGRVELPSEKGPRKASTGLVCVQSFRLGICPQTGVRQLSRRDSSRAPRKEQTHASPISLALRRRIGRRPLQRDGLCAVRMPGCLRSVGVFVIVVGNYFVAAFYEASGASTCNHGFQHPRRNQCAPLRMVPLLTRVRKTTFPSLSQAEQALNTHKICIRKGALRQISALGTGKSDRRGQLRIKIVPGMAANNKSVSTNCRVKNYNCLKIMIIMFGMLLAS